MPLPKQLTPSDVRHPYKVFISSTYIDNEDRRKIVQDAITTAGMVWHGMEIFTASTRPTVQECVRYTKEADVLVGIIAWRYGWEPEGQDKSMTDWYKIVEKSLAQDPDQAEGIAVEKADSLVQRLGEPDFRARRVFELTRNPLLLTNICLVHRHRGSLPQKRARLYEECIDVLLEHWRGAKD